MLSAVDSDDRVGAAGESTNVVQAVLVGMAAAMAGTIPRNIFFTLNLRHLAAWPWAVPITAFYLWCFWRYLRGDGPPRETASERRRLLRANAVSGRVWLWALISGGLGLVALVLALRLLNRLVVLPPQLLPEFGGASRLTVVSLLILAAPVAGVIEEASFRGYMQGPIERRHGAVVAIVITGVMFAIAHLEFTLVLLPYYVAVAAIYGAVTYLTDSILPAIALHTGGNLFSNFDLLLHGQAEWQAPSRPDELIWQSGADLGFWILLAAVFGATAAMVWAFGALARNVWRGRIDRAAAAS